MGKVRRKAPAGTGDADRPIIAGRFAFQIELAIDPPHGRMQANHCTDGALNQPCDVISALYVRPLMNNDLIQLGIGQRIECARPQRDG